MVSAWYQKEIFNRTAPPRTVDDSPALSGLETFQTSTTSLLPSINRYSGGKESSRMIFKYKYIR